MLASSTSQIRYLCIAVVFAIMSAFSQSPVPQGAVVEKIASGFMFVEEPVWRDSVGLLFSDLSGNKVYRWTQATGAVGFITPSSNAILVPGQTTNCNWGDADRKTLYITSGNSVYRIRLAVTGVEEHSSVPGDRYILYQNYPNPFNPVTTIGFRVPGSNSRNPELRTCALKLSVHDLLGREVAVLVSDMRDAGTYTAKWDASDRSSGLYFCRLSTGEFSETRTMVLAR